MRRQKSFLNFAYNVMQPYAAVPKGGCVKGAVSGVRWVVCETVSFLRIYFLSVGKL